MRFVEEKEVVNFINSKNYDIRLSRNARWIDQKCTPDVLSIIADCVIDLIGIKGLGFEFTSKDVWENKSSDQNITILFNKPSVMDVKARNEYDKFFAQPLELFAYSGILAKSKRGNHNYYTVLNMDVLTYLALREINSLKFLNIYCEKVLKDSGLFDVFETFFENPTKENFFVMKKKFVDFTITYTPINKELEPKRIFTKILNPLAFTKKTKGTEQGRLSSKIITYDMLMYNRENFRDMYSAKPKGVTRQEHNSTQNAQNVRAYNMYLVAKAIKMVKLYNEEYNNKMSEVEKYSHGESATHVHHIFPRESFPTIANYYENLICLTPTQHYNYAHVNGNTQVISKDFQYICLMSKIATIKMSYEKEYGLYNFYNLCLVLKTGLNNEVYINIPNLDFETVIANVNMDYNKL